MQVRLFLLGIVLVGIVSAQFTCHHDHVMDAFFEENPELAEEHAKIHERITSEANFVTEQRKNAKEKEILALIQIPVIWHVLVDPDNVAGTQLTEAAINREMGYLNQWLSGSNTYYNTVSSIWASRVAQPADLNIRLVLASQDANGNPTTGIEYKTTNVAKTCGDTEIFLTSSGGIDAWNTRLFFNVWTCPITTSAGYAYLPSASTHYRDGMVINPQHVGEEYRTGSIMAHELGHWLGLKHTFENCSPGDSIDDTPPSAINNLNYATYQKPCPGVGGATDDDFVQCGNRVMVQNCMDYGWEQCRTSFTKGQAAVMRGWLENPSSVRGSLGTSIGLGGGSTATATSTGTPSRTRPASATPTGTPTRSPTPTRTRTPASTPSRTPTTTRSGPAGTTASNTASNSPTRTTTPTRTPSTTRTIPASATGTGTPTRTTTRTRTSSPSRTPAAASASNTPSRSRAAGTGNSVNDKLLELHNNERDNLVTPPASPLGDFEWSSSVQAAAQSWANTCTYGFDSSTAASSYGKNLYAYTYDQTATTNAISMATGAVAAWSDTRNYYTITAKADGTVTQTCSTSNCNSYKQIIWNNPSGSNLLGCAMKYCTTGSPWGTGYSGQWTALVCYYTPRITSGGVPYQPCPAGEVCSSAGGCANTCLEGQCGQTVTNCGETIDCGPCCEEDPCSQNACGDFTACGEAVRCAECETGSSCVHNDATGFNVCQSAEDCHAAQCEANGVQCGNRLYCGVNRQCRNNGATCNADTHICTAEGQCVVNPCNNCGGNMECVDQTCRCLSGYVLSDGGAACELPSTTGGSSNPLDYSSVLTQVIPAGGNDFAVQGFDIQLTSTSGSHLLNWGGSADIVDKYTTKTRTTVSVASGTFGICIRTGQSGSARANDRIQWEIDQISGGNARVRLNLVYYGNNNYNGGYTIPFSTSDAEITVLMGFVDSSSAIRTEIQIGGYSIAFLIPVSYYPNLGSISYFFKDNSGVPTLTELLLGTSSTVSIQFVDCIDDSEWSDYFYLLTGANPATTSVEIRDSGENGNCDKKKSATGKALISGFTTVITSTSVPAVGLSSKLAASAGSINAASIGFSSATVIPGAAGAQIAGVPVTAAGASAAGGVGGGAGGGGGGAAAGGLSGGAIAGIVVGSVGGAVLVVGVAAIVVAAVIVGAVVLSKDRESDSHESSNHASDEPAPKKRGSIRNTIVGMFSGPRGGVDVMNDPKGHQSISARSPAMK